MILFEPFFLKALVAGFGVALMCGVLGCFVAWQRMAYFGDTIAHAALLGVTLALLTDIAPGIGIVAVSIALALALGWFLRQPHLASDTLLGVAAHSALAVSLVLLSLSNNIKVDIGGYLFGDILAVNTRDIVFIYGGIILITGAIAYFWRDLLRVTIHPDIAQVEGVKVARLKLILMLLVALTVAVSIKIVGMLLITALLIIPAAAARYLVSTPTQMAALASCLGVVAVVFGLAGSAVYDTPSGPSIIVVCMGLFLAAYGLRRKV